MVNIYSLLQTDSEKERKGVWVPFEGGTRILVARTTSPHYQDIIDELLVPWRDLIRAGGTPPRDVMTRITIKAMATGILLGWEGFENGEGPIVYSREAAEKLLTDLPDLRNRVASIAGTMEWFRAKGHDDDRKNS